MSLETQWPAICCIRHLFQSQRREQSGYLILDLGRAAMKEQLIKQEIEITSISGYNNTNAELELYDANENIRQNINKSECKIRNEEKISLRISVEPLENKTNPAPSLLNLHGGDILHTGKRGRPPGTKNKIKPRRHTINHNSFVAQKKDECFSDQTKGRFSLGSNQHLNTSEGTPSNEGETCLRISDKHINVNKTNPSQTPGDNTLPTPKRGRPFGTKKIKRKCETMNESSLVASEHSFSESERRNHLENVKHVNSSNEDIASKNIDGVSKEHKTRTFQNTAAALNSDDTLPVKRRGRPPGTKNKIESNTVHQYSSVIEKNAKDFSDHVEEKISLVTHELQNTSECNIPLNENKINPSPTPVADLHFDDKKPPPRRGRPLGSKKKIKRSDANLSDTNQNQCDAGQKQFEDTPNTEGTISYEALKDNTTNTMPARKKGVGRPKGVKNKPKTVSFIPKRPIKRYESSKNFTQSKKIKPKIKCKEKKTRVIENPTEKQKTVNPYTRKIPKERLEESLVMLKDQDHPIWEEMNSSCNTSIHRYWEAPKMHVCQQRLKVKYARQFMLRRDWVNLSKVLCVASQDQQGARNFYSLLAKYGSICLAHTDNQQFNKFVHLLLNMDDGERVLKKCTQFAEKCSDAE